MFQHTAARRRLGISAQTDISHLWFQHTAARRRLALKPPCQQTGYKGFNTQPPEGGWFFSNTETKNIGQFQHTAARRRLGEKPSRPRHQCRVSTHSRPKAAGQEKAKRIEAVKFQHTAARRRLGQLLQFLQQL